jgi:hypothetical protein
MITASSILLLLLSFFLFNGDGGDTYLVSATTHIVMRMRRQEDENGIRRIDGGAKELHQHHLTLAASAATASPTAASDLSMIHSVDSRSLFVGYLQIGTPPQGFWVTLDTGSSTTWVTSLLCNSSLCESHPRYNTLNSTTYVPIDDNNEWFSITYGTGEIEGFLAQDTIVFAGYILKNQVFGVVEVEEGSTFDSGEWSGILGLGFPNATAYAGELTLFDGIMDLHELNANIFSFWLSYDTQYSVFLLGSPPNEYYLGDLQWVDVKSQYYWSVDLDDILVNGKSIGLCPYQNCTAILDSGTTFNTAPTDALLVLLSSLTGTTNQEQCYTESTLKNISYVLNGIEYVLTPADYMGYSSDGEYCTPRFAAVDIDPPQGPAYILGETFFVKYFTAFDRGSIKVGLAPAAPSQSVLTSDSFIQQKQIRQKSGRKNMFFRGKIGNQQVLSENENDNN